MKKLLIIILFLLISSTPILALDPGFYSTISFTIGDIDENVYVVSPNEISGEYTQDSVYFNNIESLTSDSFKSRIYNKLQSVSVLPFSRVDIGYYWYNNTEQEIDIDTIRIPLSREHVPNGDISDIIYENIGNPIQTDITCTNRICRGGKYIDFEGVGLLSSNIGKNQKKGIVIGSVYVKPAVELSKWSATLSDKHMSELNLFVKNNTGEYLNDIWVTYREVLTRRIDLEPYEEKQLLVYKTCIFEEDSANCGVIKFVDRNIKTQCMAYGSDWGNYNRPDSISVFNKIGDEWVSGAQVQPGMQSFCITRIPYIYSTEELIVPLDPPEPEPTPVEYWKNILGFEILPITNYNLNIFERILQLIKPHITDNL